eukprot:8428330-Prorocentrum_lima.AAC.1
MTSSLVGSEMCIRDRMPDMPDFGTPLRRSTPGGNPHMPGPQGFSPEGFLAVSYTHLTLPTIC